jgi:S-(hydroxymethyl)glutathione dehydrogenase/alcohol dehydrogenase
MKTTAALLVELGKPLVLEEIEIPALKPGQVLVEIAFSGACHTQVLEARGHRGPDAFLPHCLGHEGSGTVLECGAGVSKVKAGDQVVLSWIRGSGLNVPGSVYEWQGRKVNAGAVTTFQRHALVSENRLTLLPAGVPLKEAVLLGCAAPTGMGSVINTAQPRPGQSVVVFGAGGVGSFALAGAALSGCVPVIAVDVLDSKLELARRMGATHVINANAGDPVAAIQKICPGGVDVAIEATGLPDVMKAAIESVRQQGGATVVIGNAHHGQSLTIDPKQFNMGKRVLGSWGGDNDVDRDYPRYGRLLAAGKIDTAALLSDPYRLADINAVLDDLEAGRVGRPVIDMALT